MLSMGVSGNEERTPPRRWGALLSLATSVLRFCTAREMSWLVLDSLPRAFSTLSKRPACKGCFTLSTLESVKQVSTGETSAVISS